jgi:3-oxoacyl-[acyl-carrier protein] reductase
VNALGTFQMIRACAPHLKAARGAVVNVSSVAGALGIGSSVA